MSNKPTNHTTETTTASQWSNLIQDYLHPYDRSQADLLARLLPMSFFSVHLERAITSTAILIIDTARETSHQFTLRQIFQQYPISSPEGQTLFQLIVQLSFIQEPDAQKEMIQECFSIAPWMNDVKRRDRFFQTMSYWGLSFSRFLNYPSNEHSRFLGIRLARRFGSPIIHNAIMQAIHRLTEPLIFSHSFENILQKQLLNQPRHLRLGLPYALSPSQAEANRQAYMTALEQIQTALAQSDNITPTLQIELHHFTGPLDIRQTPRVMALASLLRPIAKRAASAKVPCFLSAHHAYSMPLLRFLLNQLSTLENQHMTDAPGKTPDTVTEDILESSSIGIESSYIGIECSAAEPSSDDIIQECVALASVIGKKIPIRITKERTKPGIQNADSIHCVYLALARKAIKHAPFLNCAFATHNALTQAAVYHLTAAAGLPLEIHVRHGIGEHCSAALKDLPTPVTLRIETPIGFKRDHHHLILQRLREIADPEAFLNRLDNQEVTTASLVTHPGYRLQRHKPVDQPTDFWLGRKVSPLYPTMSVVNISDGDEQHTADTASVILSQRRIRFRAKPLINRETRLDLLKKAHQHAQEMAPLFIHLLIEHLTMPRQIAELHVEGALQQQSEVLTNPIERQSSHYHQLSRGQVLWIGSGRRTLSPLLAGVTQALLRGNQVIVKPATACFNLISQVLQTFYAAGFSKDDIDAFKLSHTALQTLLHYDTNYNLVVFDGLQTVGQQLAETVIKNTHQPPQMLRNTPAAECISTWDICFIDESASAQECFHLVNDAWKHGPMVIITTPSRKDELVDLLTQSQQNVVIDDPSDINTDVTSSQFFELPHIQLGALCTQFQLAPPVSINAPGKNIPFFEVLGVEPSQLLNVLEAIAENTQLNRLTLLTRMPLRIRQISHQIPVHELHVGWPKDNSICVHTGLDPNVYTRTTHILRHQRLHPWSNNHTFDITQF